MSTDFDYDFAVIGGGSGGMAAAKAAATHGARVVLFDYVKPSTQGTKWGLGGTCVNVGCVPKKLMHHAALFGAHLQDARKFGWDLEEGFEERGHRWMELVGTVQNHVKSLNFGYRNGLRSAQVNYINALARLEGPNTVGYYTPTAAAGASPLSATVYGPSSAEAVKRVRAKYILIATGGRPQLPTDVPGAAELAITSDDLFSLRRNPGRTLCVGASYIALECAGLLRGVGFDVQVAVRSIALRGFDRQCAAKIVERMDEEGVDFLWDTHVTKLEKTPEGRIAVSLQSGAGPQTRTEIYDTVLYATGRRADVQALQLEAAGVRVDAASGKIVVDAASDETSAQGVYAVGDIVLGAPELTPVAIKAGEYLAGRLFAGRKDKLDYARDIPTTVFTPVEYGCIGLSEEAAHERYGADHIETYLLEFTTLETAAAHRTKHASRVLAGADEDAAPSCLAKLVCLKSEDERVVGFHFVGPNAGEVTQGFALAITMGATKAHFDRLVGIHPTDAEVFTQLSITRSSGADFRAAGGCGGGKCG
eukprot:TRINITY_DN1132_c0_g2_i5.p1 TRINITY_DN1132_c0_g2~~TRINITY_DN1132_c0_g2_i5.p1  ORF type:complete len:534 (+),score=105.19 TRINITY_DN1132_c0_g2_i5:72-1673(+)